MPYYRLVVQHAVARTYRNARDHALREIAKIVIGGFLLWWLVPFGEWLSRAPDRVLYPLVTLCLYLILAFLWYLIKAPTEIHHAQAAEIQSLRSELPAVDVELSSLPRVFRLPRDHESAPVSVGDRFVIINDLAVISQSSEDVSLRLRLGFVAAEEHRLPLTVEAEPGALEPWETARGSLEESGTQILPSPLSVEKGKRRYRGYVAFRVGGRLKRALDAMPGGPPEQVDWRLEIQDSISGQWQQKAAISTKVGDLVSDLEGHPRLANSEALIETLAGDAALDSLISLTPESTDWQLSLRLQNCDKQQINGCRAEVHALERFSEDIGEFLEGAEPSIASLEEGRVANVPPRESIAYLLADANEKNRLRIRGRRPVRNNVFKDLVIMTEPGIWREEIMIYTDRGTRRVHLFFSWKPGHRPRFERDPRIAE